MVYKATAVFQGKRSRNQSILDFPISGNLTSENPMQLNIVEIIKNLAVHPAGYQIPV